MKIRKSMVLMFCCLILSAGAVGGLFILNEVLAKRTSDFVRILRPHVIMSEKVYNVGFNSYYVAGYTDNHLFFGNTTAPLHLLKLNVVKGDTQHIRLRVEIDKSHRFRSSRIKIDSPYFFLSDGTIPILFRGKINSWSCEQLQIAPRHYDQLAPLGTSSFADRSMSGSDGYVIGKQFTSKFKALQNPNLLTRQGDGIFSVDGTLHYSQEISRLVYTYFYRNEFVVADTNLHVIYVGNTIDTTRYADITVDTIHSANQVVMKSPPRLVNKQSQVWKEWLFVYSPAKAQNENEKQHDEHVVIDVYSLRDGDYQFSFYISKLKGKKPKAFYVNDNKIAALFDKYVTVYELNPIYFNGPATSGVFDKAFYRPVGYHRKAMVDFKMMFNL